MTMPGLTAEASLCRTSGRYRTATRGRAAARVQGIIPQLMPIGFCQANCQPDDWLCVMRCLEQEPGGGPGGGPQEVCRVGCGRCLPDPDSPTGRSKTCVRRDCSTVTRRC
jgi:hypothetical protein